MLSSLFQWFHKVWLHLCGTALPFAFMGTPTSAPRPSRKAYLQNKVKTMPLLLPLWFSLTYSCSPAYHTLLFLSLSWSPSSSCYAPLTPRFLLLLPPVCLCAYLPNNVPSRFLLPLSPCSAATADWCTFPSPPEEPYLPGQPGEIFWWKVPIHACFLSLFHDTFLCLFFI